MKAIFCNFKQKIDRYYIAAIVLLFIGLAFSNFLISLSIFFLFGIWIVEGNFKNKYHLLRQNKAALIFLLIFILHIIGMIWTIDWQKGLNDLKLKLPLFVLPLIFGSKNSFNKKETFFIASSFVLVIFAKTLHGAFFLIVSEFNPSLDQISPNISHIRYSLMINLSIFLILYYLTKGKLTKKIQKILLLLLALWFILFLVLIQSITGLVVFVFILIITSLTIVFKADKLYLKIAIPLLIFVIVFSIFLYLKRQYDNFYNLKDPTFSELPKYTEAGNKYNHDSTNHFLENGHRVGFYLCEKELRKEWNKRSQKKYYSTNKNGYTIKSTLVRYLTSKGLPKDSVGVANLTKKDIENIQNGLANYRFDKHISLNYRIYKIIWQIHVYKQTKNPNGQSITQRYEYLLTSFRIIEKNLFFGVGTGDAKISFENQYELDNSVLTKKNRKRSHNQLITFILVLGIFGGGICIVAFFAPFFINKKYKEFIPSVFLIIAFLSMFSDNIFETSTSTSFFAIFYSLLILQKFKIQKKIKNMISNELINPKSIVVVGGSEDIKKPGGKVLKNLIDGDFKGDLYVANPKSDKVQGLKSYKDIQQMPNVDLAIIAIAAKYSLQTVEFLAKNKKTRGFIILSAGFSEESQEGAELEKKIVDIVESVNGTLIGPNCIGLLNTSYYGVFTTPIPKLESKGIDMISGSGATAVFIMESALPKGLTFNSVWSVGNSAQTGVEDVLEYLDETFDYEKSSHVKLLYIEQIEKPKKLLKHASSLIRKGCRIAAIKAGGSEAGSRAASSHTGALASSDVAVSTLFDKAGIVRCNGREELATVAAIFQQKQLKGKNIAIITHAGGPGVMLTDALSNGGLKIPQIKGKKADELLTKLFPGSSVANPIDFLATGTAEQLGHIIDYCDKYFDDIDAMAVIFGSPGLFEIFDVYDVLDEKMKSSSKPVFPIMPSIKETAKEIKHFQDKGNQSFPDEVIFGNALTKIFNTPKPSPEKIDLPQDIDKDAIINIIKNSDNGYIHPNNVAQLLDAAGIGRVLEITVEDKNNAVKSAKKLGFPLVMKVVGPVHKSDVGGVVLNVKDIKTVEKEFDRMMKIKDSVGVLMQPMISGTEIFAGVKHEPKFGHLVLAGLGGIFIEVLKDVNSVFAPVSKNEALRMIKNLKAYKIIEGVRGQEGVNIDKFVDIIIRIGALVRIAPEINEMDINPLLGNSKTVKAVDARIKIEK